MSFQTFWKRYARLAKGLGHTPTAYEKRIAYQAWIEGQNQGYGRAKQK